jgi:hypothetical protein
MLILLWSSIAWADNHHPNGIIIDGTIGSKKFERYNLLIDVPLFTIKA